MCSPELIPTWTGETGTLRSWLRSGLMPAAQRIDPACPHP